MSVIQVSEFYSKAKTSKSNYRFWGSEQERFSRNPFPAAFTLRKSVCLHQYDIVTNDKHGTKNTLLLLFCDSVYILQK